MRWANCTEVQFVVAEDQHQRRRAVGQGSNSQEYYVLKGYWDLPKGIGVETVDLVTLNGGFEAEVLVRQVSD